MQSPATSDHSFGQVNFATAELGDERRTRRLVELADRISRHPGGSFPEKLHSPADLKALYRLCASPAVTHAAVLAPHRELTRRCLQQTQHPILVIHDSTELDYTSRKSLTTLGPIGDGRGRGYVCHNSLVVDPGTLEVQGLANQVLHQRAAGHRKESRKQRRLRKSRESRLWPLAAADLPANWNVIDVCDRGADTFEFLEQEMSSGRRFVIRSAQNRRLPGSGSQRYLHTELRRQPAVGSRTLQLTAHRRRKKRTASLAIAFLAATVLAPHKKQGEHSNKPLTLWAVRVWETQPPRGEKPLEWILLTNEPVDTIAAAERVIDWYQARWVVEEFHKAMKTGCGIEQLQFTAEERLQPAIALLSVVALTLLNLRAAARTPDAKTRAASEVVSRDYVELLSHWRHREVRNLTIHEFFYALARLGGHQNRKNDKAPGWLILWRGWTTLQTMLAGVEAIQHKRCG
jgi:Transposase DNA-binding/Transposase DDE domain